MTGGSQDGPGYDDSPTDARTVGAHLCSAQQKRYESHSAGLQVRQKSMNRLSYERFQAMVHGGIFPCLLVLGWVDSHQFKFPSHTTGGQWSGFKGKTRNKKASNCGEVSVKAIIQLSGAPCVPFFLSEVSFPWDDSTRHLIVDKS